MARLTESAEVREEIVRALRLDLIGRRCGWWASLWRLDPTDAESKTIVIPREQRFDTAGIVPLMTLLRGRRP